MLKEKVEYPVCKECENNLLKDLQMELDILISENQQYEAFFNTIQNMEPDNNIIKDNNLNNFPYHNIDNDDNETDINNLDNISFIELLSMEKQLMIERKELEIEKEEVITEKKRVRLKMKKLNKIKHHIMEEIEYYEINKHMINEDLSSIDIFAKYTMATENRLEKYNIFNDAFYIWFDGPFGTINGLRLGRLPQRPVEWIEINAALGQIALVLASIADRIKFSFTFGKKLVPRGSYSRIIGQDQKEYYLFSDGNIFKKRRFNYAMTLLLECVEDAGNIIIKQENTLSNKTDHTLYILSDPPYKIQAHKIGDLSVCLGDDEKWTNAMKYMLTYIKWLLTWVSKRYP